MITQLSLSPNTVLSGFKQIPFAPKSLEINGKTIPYQCLEAPVAIDDLFAFLERQPLYPKLYWETPEDGVFAGIGAAIELTDCPTFQSLDGPRFYGGRDFIPRTKGGWQGIPESTYILPFIELEKRGAEMWLRLNRVKDFYPFALASNGSLSLPTEKVRRIKDSPSLENWEKMVKEILEGIDRNNWSKVVLARCSSFESDSSLSPYSVLKALTEKNRFCFQFSPETAFIGTSPETLYRRQNRAIQTVALAGTRKKVGDSKMDQLSIKELLTTSKEQEEFNIIVRWIQSALTPFCDTIKCGEQTVLDTSFLYHLYRSFQGVLKDHVTDELLIQVLHPTPALGGAPKKEALREIQKKEPFDRGWYGAPVGWVSPNGSHHLVGIRSALIFKTTLNLFSGAGIVSGSIPNREWEELEAKIEHYKKVLNI